MVYDFRGIENVRPGKTYYVTKKKNSIYIKPSVEKHIPSDKIISFVGPNFDRTDTSIIKQTKVIEEIAKTISIKQSTKEYKDEWEKLLVEDETLYQADTAFSYDRRIVEAKEYINVNSHVIPSGDEAEYIMLVTQTEEIEEGNMPITKKCPLCGTMYNTFTLKGRLICDNCYVRVYKKMKQKVRSTTYR